LLPFSADAVIMGVKSNGIVVLVPKYGMESPIQLVSKDSVSESAWKFDETLLRLTGPDGVFQVFDRLRVLIFVEESQYHRFVLCLC
jgi:exoribonuclease R